MYSPEFQLKAKAMLTTFTLGSLVFGAGFTTERFVCEVMHCTTPSYMLTSILVNGCFTIYPQTRERFNEISRAIPEGQLITFVIPGTKKMDNEAIDLAYYKMKA